MKLKSFLILLLLIQFDLYVCFIEPLTLAYAAVAGVGYLSYKWRCNYYECCELKEKINLYSVLKNDLKKKVFGQPILIDVLPIAIHQHVNNENPNNPLVISLHGWTGNGKTYTSSIVAKNLFKQGLKSIYVKKVTPAVLFPDSNSVDNNKKKLIKLLTEQSLICKNSLIIIEEIDKLHPELIDTLSSYLNNYNPFINHMIFIFTSNVGSNKIVEKSFEYYNLGKKREDIKLNDLEPLIRNQVYNDESSMKYSSLVTSHLINHYIPYFPLERSHVDQCIRDYMLNYYGSLKNYDEAKDFVYKSLEWWPLDLKLYSNSGCKQVANKVDISMRFS